MSYSNKQTKRHKIRVATWDDNASTVYPILTKINPGPGTSAAPVAGGILPAPVPAGDRPYSREFSLTDCDEVGIYVRVADVGDSPQLTKIYMRYQVTARHTPPSSSTLWTDIRVDDIDSSTGISRSIPYTIEIDPPYLGAETVHSFRFPANFGQWGRVFVWGESSSGGVFTASPGSTPIVLVYVYKQ